MTYFRTCRNCVHAKDCQKKNDIKAAIKGLGITSIKHTCGLRQAPYTLGDPVIVQTCFAMDAGDEYEVAYFPGHFLREARSKAIVYVPDRTPCIDGTAEYGIQTKNGRGFIKVPFNRVKPNPNGEPIEACSECGPRQHGCEQFGCPFRASTATDEAPW